MDCKLELSIQYVLDDQNNLVQHVRKSHRSSHDHWETLLTTGRKDYYDLVSYQYHKLVGCWFHKHLSFAIMMASKTQTPLPISCTIHADYGYCHSYNCWDYIINPTYLKQLNIIHIIIVHLSYHHNPVTYRPFFYSFDNCWYSWMSSSRSFVYCSSKLTSSLIIVCLFCKALSKKSLFFLLTADKTLSNANKLFHRSQQ